MVDIQGYHAHIQHGDTFTEVYDEQPEIFVAKVLEHAENITGAEDAPTQLRVDAIPHPKEAIESIASSVRAAIEKDVDTAMFYVQNKDAWLQEFGPGLGSAAIALWERQSAVDPGKEVDRLHALSPDGGFTILDGESTNWGQALQDRLRDMGVLSVGKQTPPLARESLQDRLRGAMDDAVFERLAQTYDGLPDLSGVVEDANIRRLCSALTNCGFETRYSCEGHGYELAHVKFVCTPEQKDELQALLDASKDRLKEEWTIIEDHMDKATLRYRLQPTHQDSRSTRHNRVIADLDVIGMLVLQKFPKKETKSS